MRDWLNTYKVLLQKHRMLCFIIHKMLLYIGGVNALAHFIVDEYI